MWGPFFLTLSFSLAEHRKMTCLIMYDIWVLLEIGQTPSAAYMFPAKLFSLLPLVVPCFDKLLPRHEPSMADSAFRPTSPAFL